VADIQNASAARDHARSVLEGLRQVAIADAKAVLVAAKKAERDKYDAKVIAATVRIRAAADAFNSLPAVKPTDADAAKAHDATVTEHVAARAALDSIGPAPDHRALLADLNRSIGAADQAFNVALRSI
jgi:hypothetical protein